MTQESFEAFIADVAELCQQNKGYIVLLGRTGSIEEAWITLIDKKVSFLAYEIGFFEKDSAIEFASQWLNSDQVSNIGKEPYIEAIREILKRLRDATALDDNRFAGYAPVLQTVAERVRSESNPAQLISAIRAGGETISLMSVAEAILDRERNKLDGLDFSNPVSSHNLYSRREQLDRLTAEVYGTPKPPMPNLSPDDLRTYSVALETWVSEHPFLDGGKKPSTAVFGAVLAVYSLGNPTTEASTVNYELAKGKATNPFISDFYLGAKKATDAIIPPNHIGLLYSSIRAKLSVGGKVRLVFEGSDGDDESDLDADLEFVLESKDSYDPIVLDFKSNQVDSLKLGSYLEDFNIVAPHARVELGAGPEVQLVAPGRLECSTLVLNTSGLSIESNLEAPDCTVHISAQNLESVGGLQHPLLRGGAELRVRWPGSKNYPWTEFSLTEDSPLEHNLDEALRRFRKFITAFRSHSKGRLARYRQKIDHSRMTKGSGQKVLDALIRDKILSLEGPMYFLDADKLGAITKAKYSDCVDFVFGAETIAYISSVVQSEP